MGKIPLVLMTYFLSFGFLFLINDVIVTCTKQYRVKLKDYWF